MCRGLWRSEDRIPHSLRILRRELAAPQDRGLFSDAFARKILEGKNPSAAREKCPPPGHRTIDRFAGCVSAAASQVDRSDRRKQRTYFDSSTELWRAPRDHRWDQESASSRRTWPHRQGND